MRLLFVLPELPTQPFTGAHTRPLTMLRAATRSHEVVVLGSARAGSDLRPLRELCVGVLAATDVQARPAGRRMLAAGRRLVTPVPLVGRGRSPALAALVERALKHYRPDALFLETMYAIHYRQPRLAAIVDLPDVVSGLCEAAAAAHPARYAVARAQAALSRRQEAKLLRGTVPVTVNDDDRRRLAEAGITAYTVPLAISPPPEQAVEGKLHLRYVSRSDPLGSRQPLQLLFVGSYAHAPNREAARFLVQRLAPALRASSIDFRLVVAGRAAPSWLARAGGAGVHVVSDVDNLTPLYRGADIVLVPLAHGGGTKNKTLEAMAWSLPVVGTRQAFTGLGAADGVTHMVTSLDAREMTAAVVALAADPDRRARMGKAARRYVLDYHSPHLAESRAAALFDAVSQQGCMAEAEQLWRDRQAAAAGAASECSTAPVSAPVSALREGQT